MCSPKDGHISLAVLRAHVRACMHVRRGESKRRTQTVDSSAFISVSHVPTRRGIGLSQVLGRPVGGSAHQGWTVWKGEQRAWPRKSRWNCFYSPRDVYVYTENIQVLLRDRQEVCITDIISGDVFLHKDKCYKNSTFSVRGISGWWQTCRITYKYVFSQDLVHVNSNRRASWDRGSRNRPPAEHRK